MRYAFVLGRVYTLSIAELAAVLDLRDSRLLAADFLTAEIGREINVADLIKRLGGMIKIGRIAAEIKSGDDSRLGEELKKVARAKQMERPLARVFGVDQTIETLFKAIETRPATSEPKARAAMTHVEHVGAKYLQ